MSLVYGCDGTTTIGRLSYPPERFRGVGHRLSVIQAISLRAPVNVEVGVAVPQAERRGKVGVLALSVG